MRSCAFLSVTNLDEFVTDDELVLEPLRKRGWNVSTVPWEGSAVDWDRFEVVVVRTTWDYHKKPAAFLRALQEIERSRARLENPLALMCWNLEKTYLRELAAAGIPVVPTLWREALAPEDMSELFADLETDEVVVKPVVGANADDTLRLRSDPRLMGWDPVEELFGARPCMIQPFLPAIADEGEFSLIFFGQRFSHALLKTPAQGDFRVQEERGGTIRPVEPEPLLLRTAQRTVKSLEADPLYARVDCVRGDDGFFLMELELIEPCLYFRMDTGAPERFAAALDSRMGS